MHDMHEYIIFNHMKCRVLTTQTSKVQWLPSWFMPVKPTIHSLSRWLSSRYLSILFLRRKEWATLDSLCGSLKIPKYKGAMSTLLVFQLLTNNSPKASMFSLPNHWLLKARHKGVPGFANNESSFMYSIQRSMSSLKA